MFGVAPISVLGTAPAVGSAPEQKAGAAAATGQTAYVLGLALGIALTGTLAAAVYRGETPDSAPAEARDTVGAAIAAAERLPDGAALLAAAKDAFTTGLQTAALVAVLLRHVPPIGTSTPTEPRQEQGPGTPAPQPATSAL
ncbi:hypothetical protein ACIRFH_01700 [Streptomyces sp. NPDC093586]|uniref:hypothetical protein n=1 Tax=Streptomyces sp. NPDC093586 TaxID=3366042 RepID=UPI0037FEE2A2